MKDNIELSIDKIPFNLKNYKDFDADNTKYLYNKEYKISNNSSKENKSSLELKIKMVLLILQIIKLIILMKMMKNFI